MLLHLLFQFSKRDGISVNCERPQQTSSTFLPANVPLKGRTHSASNTLALEMDI